jgi:hypothetical protein
VTFRQYGEWRSPSGASSARTSVSFMTGRQCGFTLESPEHRGDRRRDEEQDDWDILDLREKSSPSRKRRLGGKLVRPVPREPCPGILVSQAPPLVTREGEGPAALAALGPRTIRNGVGDPSYAADVIDEAARPFKLKEWLQLERRRCRPLFLAGP